MSTYLSVGAELPDMREGHRSVFCFSAQVIGVGGEGGLAPGDGMKVGTELGLIIVGDIEGTSLGGSLGICATTATDKSANRRKVIVFIAMVR